MIGYGPEDDHFVLELTYNYGIGSYAHGNDFKGIHIHSPDAYKRASEQTALPVTKHTGYLEICDPAGYRFYIHDSQSATNDPVQKIEIAASNLQRSIGKLDLQDNQNRHLS